ncbi:hypothetical protein FOCC_FOCC012666 [Frankliniella occidentalis]|nr:hypothetical protein FOCC_FOCC012666 [Frankliniella occidentalis]
MVKNQLHLNGFIYYKVNSKSGRTYWICKRGKAKECPARAITLTAAGGGLTVVKGDEQSPHHSHPPNREGANAGTVATNLKRLSQQHPDGTLKVCPGLFVQIFTISGLVKRMKPDGEGEVPAVPLIFAFLTAKKEEHYGQVLKEVISAAREQQVPFTEPARAMSDFELAILNSIQEALPVTEMQCCFFHLGQSMYRKIRHI